MGRNLNAAQEAQAAKRAAEPTNFLKIEFNIPALGTKWYSDKKFAGVPVFAQDRVVDWGAFSMASTAGQSLNSISDISITLRDEDRALRGYLQTVEFQRTKATLYQWWEGEPVANMVPLLVGMINGPVEWNESDVTVAFDITDISSFREQTVGNIISKEDFPYINPDSENKIVPIVMGRVERSDSVQTVYGLHTALMHKLNEDATEFAVSDASIMPQTETIKLWVGNELIKGNFKGNLFLVQQRGVKLWIGETTKRAEEALEVVSSDFPDPIAQFIDMFIAIKDRTGTMVTRQIIGSKEDGDTLVINIPIWNGFEPWHIPGGVYVEIGTKRQMHEAGSKVSLYMGGADEDLGEVYTWIVNDDRSKAIERVEVWGVQKKSIIYNKADAGGTGEEKITDQVEGWVTIPETDYWYNLDNNEIFPDRVVTTVHMRRNPKDLVNGIFLSNELKPTVQGMHNLTTGELYENPGYVISKFMEKRMDMTSADFHAGSWATAISKLGWLKFGCKITQERNALEIVNDLALQCRCALSWENGLARLNFLYNRLNETDDPPLLEITTDKIDLDRGPVAITQGDLTDIVTEIIATWRENGEDRRHPYEDSSAITQFERRTKHVNFWALTNKTDIDIIVSFWLNRWKHIYEQCRLYTFLRSLEVYCGDPVKVEIADFWSSQMAKVVGIEHAPGNAEGQAIDNIALKLEFPLFAGCASSCELYCETACESDCMISCMSTCMINCESWTCESTCQDACMLVCVDSCELTCTTYCEYVCVAGCEVGCEASGCETICESQCESYDCETNCESDACETDCVLACMTDCQSYACETAGCETNCESAACESYSCTTTCDGGCQAGGCQVSCTIGCTMGCRGPCELDCMTCCMYIATETGCITEGCETVCRITPSDTGGCQYMCTASCTTDCEHACQTCCQHFLCETYVQSGCDTSCESDCTLEGCTATCVITCMTTCIVVCMTTCDQECMSVCQSDCTTTCASICQTTCMTTCRVTPSDAQCQTSCVTQDDIQPLGCTDSCETDCMVWCQIGACQSGCEIAVCETVNQTSCAIECETACMESCELMATGHCALGCEASGCETMGCEVSCVLGCELTGCETLCEGGCETLCQSVCQSGCQSGCEITCESGCEIACESLCETACQSTCELVCQTGCVVTCESGCEITCESGCEVTCESGCEITCESGCETSCESICETTCQTGCQIDCQLVCEESCRSSCTASGCELLCQGTCEMLCQDGCTTICMTTCQGGCQTGCEVVCQVAPPQTCGVCEAACEGGCTTWWEM